MYVYVCMYMYTAIFFLYHENNKILKFNNTIITIIVIFQLKMYFNNLNFQQ